MNILLAEPEEIIENRLVVTDHRAEHLVKVLKSEVGDKVRVGLIDGLRGFATVVEIKKKYPFSTTLDVQLTDSPPEIPRIDLILALPRPIMLKRILSQMTAVGVGTIYLVNGKRVEKSFWKSNLLNPKEYRVHLLHGLEQAVDTRLPKVSLHHKFKPFIEDFYPQISTNYSHKIVAHPGGEYKLMDVIQSGTGRTLLAIGPEGGWVDYEVDKFRDQGFSCCSVGSRILKVDTATIALHSMILATKELRAEAV